MDNNDPALDQDSNPVNFLMSMRKQAINRAVTSLTDDPDKAARASELSRATGTPAPVIYGDLENFELQHKAKLTASLLNDNDYLRSFIDADPMAAATANDDYANLDKVSAAVKFLGLTAKNSFTALFNAPEGFKKGFGEEPIGSWIMKDPEGVKNHPFLAAASAGIGTYFELPFRIFGGVQEQLAQDVEQLGSKIDPGLGRDLGAMVQSAGMTGRTGLAGHPVNKTIEHYYAQQRSLDNAAKQERVYISPLQSEHADAMKRTLMYVESGREPPPTVLPEYDAYRAEQNAKDVQSLTEVVKDAQSSLTRERDPDLFRGFIAQHTDAEVGISGNAVAMLYGDKVPHVDDGLLGWAPRIAEQLELARQSGDDVSIPLADLVAKIEPDVLKVLTDDIRMRPNAITTNEMKLSKEVLASTQPPPLPPIAEEVPTLRGASALEPMLSIGDRKLQLQRMLQEQSTGQFGPEQGFHDFNLLDERGNVAGYINISEQAGGKDLYVDMISGVNGLGPRDFGPALMRDIKKQLKAEFPTAEWLVGHRVSGMREKMGTEMGPTSTVRVKLDRATDAEMRDFQQVLQEGQWARYAEGIDVNLKPTETYTKNERAIVQAVQDELARIVPQGVDSFGVAGIRGTDNRPIHGAYLPTTNRKASIIFSLLSDSPLNTARHEAIHHLRMYGFYKTAEWQTLEAAALAEGWIKKHGIDSKYYDAHPTLKLEEAIAEEFQAWARRKDELARRGAEVAMEPSPLDAIFQKMYDFMMAIKERVAKVLGHEPTWEELFQSTLEGDIGARKGTEPINPAAFKAKMQFGEERQIFEKANAAGMSMESMRLYDKNVQERHAEDIAAATKRIEAAQRKVQTAAWKAERAELRKQVADDINLRPDIAADNYFADGVLYGNKVPDHQKLGTDFLTPEQRQLLPRDYYNKSGVHPDDLAGLFGYPDGASLVAHLSGLSEIRRQSGMRPIDFKRRMIDIETDRQMRLKHGVLEDNIIDAVKEQVASETQLNILHQDTIRLGIQAMEADKTLRTPLDQQTIKTEVAKDFEKYSATSISSDRFLAAAGRAGRAVELALLKGKPAEAFVAKQQQYYATLLAKHAVEFEAKTAKFEKLTQKLSKREVKNVDAEFVDFIHELLTDAGIFNKRSLDEIAANKAHFENTTLEQFVKKSEYEGYGLEDAIGDSVLSGRIKPLDAMSVGEMTEFMDAVEALNHVGRAVDRIEVDGEKMRKAEFRERVISNLKQMTPLTRQQQNFGLGKLKRMIDAPLTRTEEILKDADLRQELGPLWNAIIRPLMHSKAHEYDLFTDLSKHFKEVRGNFGKEWRRSLNDTINQDLIVDPTTGDHPSERVAYDMTRENLLQVMLNWGNRSNIAKFVQGAAMAKWGRRLSKEEFPIYEAQIKALIDKHATAEDWQFVKAMWEPFKKWRPEMETMSRNTIGRVPKMIEATPIETRHGTIEGGYWPVKYDRLGSNIIEDAKPNDKGVFGNNYFRASTATGHLKERTGYVDFVDINTSLEQAVGVMQQTMHDMAFRQEILQAANILYDKPIRAAMNRYMGKEYTEQLIPWLRDVANRFSTDDKAARWYNDWMRRARINLVGHSLPLNLKVIGSPDIGTLTTGAKVTAQTVGRILQAPLPDEWASFRSNREANIKLAMEKSDEIRHLVYNMDRDFRESMERVTANPTISDFQKKAVTWGFVPISKVSQEFRISTFVKHYNEALAKGRSEAEAAAIADSFVRERHGAASTVDLPAIMRGNEAMKMLTMFYGFFNTMYNWQRQIPGNIRRGEVSKAFENYMGSVVVGAAFGALLFNQSKQDDSWTKHIAKALLLQPLSTVPFVREGASYLAEGFQPRTPLGSLLGAAGSIISDTKKLATGTKVKDTKIVQHGANVIGLTTGLPLAQVGRTAQFGVDLATGKQKVTPFARSPYKNITEYARGIITGEAKLKK